MAASEPRIPPATGDDRPMRHPDSPRVTDPWRWRAAILARAGRLLAAPSEGEPNLQAIVRLFVPYLADWCTIDLVGNDNAPQAAALAHVNPRQREALRERWQRYTSTVRFPNGYVGVAHSRKLLALRRLTDRPRRATGANQAFFEALADLRTHAALVVPLVANGPLLGVMTLALVRLDRHFAHDDVPIAQQVAHFCALAIENARLFRTAQAEIDERRDAEHFLQATFDALGAQIAVLDSTGTITHVNAAWHRFASANRYSGSDHGLGRNYLTICDTATGPDAEDAAAFAAGIRDVMEHRRDEFALAYPCHTPTQQRWFLGRITRFADDEPRRLIVAHEDITEQQRAEAALQTSEARFRTIFLHATDAIVITDGEGRYLQANPAACTLFGVPHEADLIGRMIGDLVPHGRREAALVAWRRSLADSGTSIPDIIERGDGTTRSVEYRSTANFLPGQHLSILHDITERELAAIEMGDIQRQLTAARETERLRLARELHDTAVQQLLGVSFQLATPRDVAGTTGQQAELAATLAETRRAILDTVSHLRGVIRELRPPGLAEFGLAAALDGYLSAIKRERGTALPDIVIDLDHIGDDLPHDVALCLFRVAQEALQNAIRHANAREIIVSLFRSDREVSLRVTDDGHGFLLPERLSTYTQLGHFGLAGMVERVKLNGGQLTIDSSPDNGTTVAVQIPIAPEGG